MMRAISSADFVSKPCEAELTLSVVSSCSSLSVGLWIGPSSTVLVMRVAGVKVAMVVFGNVPCCHFTAHVKMAMQENAKRGYRTMTPAAARMSRSLLVISCKLAPEAVVKARPQRAYRLIRSVRPGPVCQQGDSDTCIQINPQ